MNKKMKGKVDTMYKSLEEICNISEETGKAFWEVVQEDDCKEQSISKEESFNRMLQMYQSMKAADENYDGEVYSSSHLVGTDGAKMQKARQEKKTICGDFIATVMEKAIKMGESNACMKRIVAAPTAGSCGVIPAVYISVQNKNNFSDEKMTEALYVAAGIGGVIADRAFLAGAAGGCQAEIGSASAMAAGGVAYLLNGSASEICNAAALALKSLLGLVCDPVAGLVEVPCVKRNVIGAVNSLTAADMSIAGIKSKIPADEVIDAMRNIGRALPETLKETGKGGLAETPTGIKEREKLALIK